MVRINEIQSAYKIGRQTKFLHKKEFCFYKGDEKVLNTTIDFKMTDEELENELIQMKEMSGADRIVLTWTANEGFCNIEIDL